MTPTVINKKEKVYSTVEIEVTELGERALLDYLCVEVIHKGPKTVGGKSGLNCGCSCGIPLTDKEIGGISTGGVVICESCGQPYHRMCVDALMESKEKRCTNLTCPDRKRGLQLRTRKIL